jgi:hypothetical protein
LAPRCWAAKEITEVVPPKAAERVAVSKLSALISPLPESCSIWQWVSTPPGKTSLPFASISCAPVGRSSPIAAMRPAWMPRSALNTSVAVASVPPRMTMS